MRNAIAFALVCGAISFACSDPYLSANLACVAKYPTRAQIDACRLLTHDAGPQGIPDGIVVTTAPNAAGILSAMRASAALGGLTLKDGGAQ